MVFLLTRERPKVVVKADVLPAVSVLSLLGMVGIPVGWLWSRLAPPQVSVIASDRRPQPLDIESWHAFDALVIFALLTFAAGVFVGAFVWLMRERRGPVIMFAAVLGSLLAAWLAILMGGAFVGGLYSVEGAPAVGDIVRQAPEISTGWVMVAQPLATALTYGVLAAWNGSDDLGRRLG